MPALTMIVSAAAIIVLVKYGLLRGIDHIAGAMNWSAKARGQLTGYATSVPEFVCLVAAGLAGVWEAGLWNIASSNIINVALMLMAVTFYRQFGKLFNMRFFDEIVFAGLAVAVPIVLMRLGMDSQWYLIPILLSFFLVYQFVDKRVNRAVKGEEEVREAVGSLHIGITLGVTTLIAIAISGMFLGELKVHPAIAGWILGVVTSIPEMVSFFAVYAASKRDGQLGELNDTQEALDNLTGSNMANVGFVYPVGLFAYLMALLFWAG